MEEESITKGDLEVTVQGPAPGSLGTPGLALAKQMVMRTRQILWAPWKGTVGISREK